MRYLNEIIVHHSLTKDSGSVSWRAIRRFHINDNGWPDIGYHFGIELVSDVFDSGYEILMGRSITLPGAHTKGHNTTTVGICCVGNFDLVPPSKEQLGKLKFLINVLKFIFPTIDKVSFHRDYASKSCPGNLFTKEMLDA